jgi:predicted outer membrane repeat protein
VNQNGGNDQNTGAAWAAAKSTIQSGIETAFANLNRCDVWVAQGTYRPTFKADPFAAANTATLQMRAGIKAYGGFAGNELALSERNVATRLTIVDGAPDAVMAIVTAADGARLDGFIVDGGGVAGPLSVVSGSFELAWCTFRNIDYTGFYAVRAGATLVVSDSLFHDSQRPLESAGTLVVRRSVFRNNHLGPGGATITSTGVLEVSDSTFTGNGSAGNSGGSGGAIYVGMAATALVERCTFRDNQILGDAASMTTTGLAFGGAIDSSYGNSQLTIRDSTFENNGVRGRLAGGGAIRGEKMTIVNTQFIGNHSESAVEADGGAIVAEGLLDVIGGTFRGNSAQRDGGAVRCRNGCRFAGTSFDANAATARNGGAVYRSGSATVSFASCAFSNNTAGLNGGAIANYSSSAGLAIAASTFFGNAAANFGGGLYTSNNGQANVSNSIFWANSATVQGPQIYNGTNVTLTIASSDVQGSGFSGANGNIDADPQFLNVLPSAVDLRLNSGSPCVNAGNSALLPFDVLDMDRDTNMSEALPLDAASNVRVSGPAVDIGAFER